MARWEGARTEDLAFHWIRFFRLAHWILLWMVFQNYCGLVFFSIPKLLRSVF